MTLTDWLLELLDETMMDDGPIADQTVDARGRN